MTRSRIVLVFSILAAAALLAVWIATPDDLASTSSLDSPDEKPGADSVVVDVLRKPLPSKEEKKEKFLWDTFANKSNEEKFRSYTTENWIETFELFAAALVKKAGDQKLDSMSLRGALELILKDSQEKIAYLPIGAYQTTLDGKLVWIVTVKWEYPEDEPDQGVNLGHIRVFVFDQKTLKQVGFMTCG